MSSGLDIKLLTHNWHWRDTNVSRFSKVLILVKSTFHLTSPYQAVIILKKGSGMLAATDRS
jgi:hypothetical protein